MVESVETYRKLGSPKPQVFDISEITDAFHYFMAASRTGKVAVSYENPESLIPVCQPFIENLRVLTKCLARSSKT